MCAALRGMERRSKWAAKSGGDDEEEEETEEAALLSTTVPLRCTLSSGTSPETLPGRTILSTSGSTV